jgi:hypothetical protein
MKAELTCVEFEARIHELLDQRRPLDSSHDLLEHSADCRFCAKTLFEYQVLTLPGRFSVRESTGFSGQSTAAELDRKVKRSSSRCLKKFLWGLAPSFAALLMVAIGMWWAPQHRTSDPQLAGNSNPSGPNLFPPAIPSPDARTDRLVQSPEWTTDSQGRPDFSNPTPSADASSQSLADRASAISQLAGDGTDYRLWEEEDSPFWESIWDYQNSSPIRILELTESYRVLPQKIQRQTLALWHPEPLDYLKTKLVPWHPVLDHTPEFWGIHPATSSIVLTLNWLQKSIMKSLPQSGRDSPDLGSLPDPHKSLLPFLA